MLSGENSHLNSALSSAKQAEQEATSSAQRFEMDLSDLAGAYNNLEVHSFQLEAQVRKLQGQLAQSITESGAGMTCLL